MAQSGSLTFLSASQAVASSVEEAQVIELGITYLAALQMQCILVLLD